MRVFTKLNGVVKKMAPINPSLTIWVPTKGGQFALEENGRH